MSEENCNHFISLQESTKNILGLFGNIVLQQTGTFQAN
jgi:hypothetical protein